MKYTSFPLHVACRDPVELIRFVPKLMGLLPVKFTVCPSTNTGLLDGAKYKELPELVLSRVLALDTVNVPVGMAYGSARQTSPPPTDISEM